MMKTPAYALFTTGRDDSDLLVRLRRRDPEAAGMLYDRYGKAAHAVALRIVKEPAVAEDVVAEAFLKVWNRVASFKETRCSALGLWFVAVVFCHAHEHLQQRAGQFGANLLKVNVVDEPVIYQDWPRALDSDRTEEIHAALDQLTPDERKALDLCFFEALPPGRLPERLGLTSGEATKVVESALAKLAHATAG